MPDKLIQDLYGGEVQIVHTPGNHTYRMKGRDGTLISVTSATGMIDKSRVLVPWAIELAERHLMAFILGTERADFARSELVPVISEAVSLWKTKRDEAADTGSQVHAYAEAVGIALAKGEPMPDLPDDAPEPVHAGINAFLNWLMMNNVRFEATERIVYSREHDYVGLADAIVDIGGKRYVVDYKTSKGVYNDHRAQVAGYRKAYVEETGEQVGSIIVHFSKETGEVSEYYIGDDDHAADLVAFLACLDLRRWDKSAAKSKI